MDEVFRKINDLALQTGRALQSPETGFIHYFYQKAEGPYQAVPIYENFLFALALCRVKSVESVGEAKVLLEKLLSYQLPSGLFPVYLHDFPNAYDKYIGAKLLPPLHWLYHYFHLPLGKEMSEKLLNAINKLKENPYPANFAEPQTAAFLEGPEHAEAEMKKALQNWHSDLQCYVGPFNKIRFTKGVQELTLYDLYMSAYTHELSPRLQGIHPIFLQGALIFPSHFECKKVEVPSFSFTPEGEYPFAFQWGTNSDISLLALSAPRAKKIDFDGKNAFTIALGANPNLEMKEEGKEVVWYASLGTKILVNGLPATTFRAGDLISIEDDKIRFELKFQPTGGVFQGHLSRGQLPSEIHNGRFVAYQWLLSWRTIDRTEDCILKVHFDYAFKN